MNSLKLTALAAVLVFLNSAPQVSAQETDPVSAAKNAADSLAVAWNKADASAMADIYSMSADNITSTGQRTVGRPAIKKLYATALSSIAYKGSKHKLIRKSARLVGSEVVLLDVESELSGMKDKSGGKVGVQRILYSALLIQEEGKWKISALRSMTPRTSD